MEKPPVLSVRAKIGRVLIGILKRFGMGVLAYDLFKNTEAAREIEFDYVSLDALYREADVISLHCPLNQDTFHMIN